MTVYIVHLPEGSARGSRQGLDRAILVKDGFHWLAFLFPLLWPLFNRLWLVFLAVFAIMVGLGIGGRALSAPGWAIGAIEFMLALLLGVAAGDLKSWGLGRRGIPAVDVVAGADEEDAERRFFARWLSGVSRVPEGHRSPTTPSYPAPQSSVQPVMGLFPDADRGAR